MEIPTNKLAEGKTKIIWELPSSDEVLIESKDDITAGDGERRDTLEGKAVLATQTTANCFALLERAGIPTHFVKHETPKMFRAKKVEMIPIELVARRVAFGSYLKRNHAIVQGMRFNEPEIEMFDKDDSLHDPLLHFDRVQQVVQRHDAKKPFGSGYIDSTPLHLAERLVVNRWEELQAITRDVFEVLEAAWADQGVTLVDMKIECGIDTNGNIVVADVIDNDSWRIWPNNDQSQMKDKQVYRDESAPLEDITKNYAWVAEATERFAT